MTERKLHNLPNEKVTNDRIKNKSFGKSKRCGKKQHKTLENPLVVAKFAITSAKNVRT